MRVKKAFGIFVALVFAVSICILTYRYYLFTNDTLHFHSYLHQADGFRVLIFDDGDVAVNTQINADDESYTEIQTAFSTAKLRPSPKAFLEKLISGNTNMEGSTDTDLTMYITFLQDSQPVHTVFLGGSNIMYFDKKGYGVGDFSNASEMRIMEQVMSSFENVSVKCSSFVDSLKEVVPEAVVLQELNSIQTASNTHNQ